MTETKSDNTSWQKKTQIRTNYSHIFV